MSNELKSILSQLQELNLSVRHGLEIAELYVPLINQQFDQLHAIGLLERQMCLGDVVHEGRYNAANGPEDSTWLLQAALGISYGGIGIVHWDAHDLWEYRNSDGTINTQMLVNFTAFEGCPSAIKGLLVPQVEPLVLHACRLLRP
ncbi:MAG: hypothetical protein KDA42_13195 [Planctomycetales bacterium]|nr:hypothetical protein [Planctomycetales bacterium]